MAVEKDYQGGMDKVDKIWRKKRGDDHWDHGKVYGKNEEQ
jgi:hypothetical protein